MYAYSYIFYFSLPQNVDKSVKPQKKAFFLKMDIKMLNNFSDICAKETGCVITTLKSSVKIKTKTFSVSIFRQTAKVGRKSLKYFK